MTHKITGYRELTDADVELINMIKEQGENVGRLLALLDRGHIDQRWVSIGRTDLQKGFMSLVRAVAQPESF